MSEARARRFTLSALNLIAFSVREGNASKDDARALLTLFCQCVEHGQISARNPVADRLLEHVREAFRTCLKGERSVESALGLVRKPGRPNADASRNEADEQTRMQMAAAVLRHRLAGSSHQDALAAVENKFCWGQTIIGKAWATNKQNALILLRNDRIPDGFTVKEKARLVELFKDEEWLIAPGNSAVSPK